PSVKTVVERSLVFLQRWVQGFTNRNVGFVNHETICYPCGNYILFVDIETKKKTVLQCKGGRVGAFAVNGASGVVAFSDQKLNPIIYIYTFPGLVNWRELKGQAQLDYTLLAFSYMGPYLASYSSVPEFALSIWNWQENVLLCSKSQLGMTATSLSFNPLSWHQLCMSSESSITIWNIERSDEEHHLKPKPVQLPAEDGSQTFNQNPFFSHPDTQDAYYGPVLPNSAIAGLIGDEAELFRPKDDIQPSVHPTVHCWSATSDLYVGCEEGCILVINSETLETSLLHQKFPTGKKHVAVGTKTGHVHFIDATKVKTPRVVHRVLLTHFSVLCLNYDEGGQYLIAGAAEGHIFILDARPSKLFEVLGYLGNICRSVHSFVLSVFVEVMALLCPADIRRARLEIFCLPSTVSLPAFLSFNPIDNDECVDERGLLKEKVIQKQQYELDYPLSSAVRQKDGTIYGYCSHAPFICKYNLASKVFVFSEERIQSNQSGRGFLFLSPNNQWLASVAEDGVLFIRDTVNLETFARAHCHSYQGGGIRSLAFSKDGQSMLTSGVEDGALVCLKWKYKCYFYSILFYYPHLFSSFSNIFIICQAIKEETEKFADKKKELKKGIKSLRKTIQEMMHENEQVPEIEKLDQQEFNLDAEEQERLQLESEQEVARVRKEIEMENLANCYLRDVLKQQCWDSMSVKGRAVKSFHTAYEVKNYPMKERGKEELETLEKVLQLKKIECIRKEIIEFQLPTVSSKEEGEKVEEDVVADETTPIALIGSLSAQYGGDTAVLYPQMDLHTREQKINQIILLQDIIYRVKTAFNKEFDIVARQKEQEIARVKERNLRIQEILTQLDLQEEVWEPTLTDDEIPERVLTVQDSEVIFPFFPFLVQDNARQRALNDMMDGVLEVKKEDILKMEIPPPPFISKPDTLWNEEEKKIFKEYEKKVKELNEEREKHRKILETELKKLQTAIQETTQSFDDTVCKLFEKKVKSEMVICQEELKINSLLYSLLLDEELSTREAGLHYFLEKKRKEKLSTAEAVQIARRQVDAYRETYDNLVAEDKILERGFRKEFSDVPMHLIDQLFKLYKRRPRAQKMKMHLDTANPYGDRPGSAKAYKDALAHLMRAMNELDNPENMPEGLDLPVWERFCSARRIKVESEQLVKRKALTLAEMQAFLQRRIEDDEKIKKDIDNIFSEVNLLQEQKMRFQLDLTVQFLLKQGQVELESSELIPDYTDAILINKSVIEELNCTIRAQGEKKIASMVECKDFSKGIFQLEWEHKKMKMQMEDLNQKARDIQTLRVSKDRQLFLNVLNYDSRVNHQVSVLEQTLGVMDKLHKEKVKKCQKIIKDLQKRISLKEQANYKLSRELQEMLVSVSERRHIFEAAASEKIAKEHYQDIVQRRQLVDLAKGQAQEIAILQAEVARLRMKTFPALYQVEY
uniref:Cilia- and flagella-associated protein 43 n=1 Tax=Crocodylus porosus TaxID=8502 RepID=A0A7M4F3D5_CROPO